MKAALSQKTNTLLGYVAIFIVVIGIALRLNVYWQNRSLRIDEANLARNIVEKGYTDFFQSLDYAQYAPPLFSMATKASTQLLGVNEPALRLVPLLGGIFSLLLLLLLVNRLIEKHAARWYILLLFAFSMLALRYGTECKQYATDAALSLCFLCWALQEKERKMQLRFALRWALAGALAIWLSMPIIFVLAAIGMAFLLKAWRRDRTALWYLVGMGAVWLFNFGAYFLLLLHQDASTDYLQNYHDAYFFNFFPTSRAAFFQSVGLVEGLFRFITDQTAISIIWAVLTFLMGVFALLRKQRFVAFLLLMPIFFCFVASHLQFYSLVERLNLFMVPLFMLIMGVGISFLWTKSGRLRWLWLVPMLISIINTQGYSYFWKRLEIEDNKGVMRYLAENRTENELIFVQHDGVPAFIFYNDYYDKAWHFKNYYLATWEESPAVLIADRLQTADNFWLFLSHTFPEENIRKNIASAASIGVELKRFETVQASVYYFKIKEL